MSKWATQFRDSRWQQKRLEIMQRDEWMCQSCYNSGEGVTLNVHHTYYEKGRAPWEYEDDSLITLCEPCHKCVTDATRSISRSIGRISPDHLDAITSIIDAICKTAKNGPYGIEDVAEEKQLAFGRAIWEGAAQLSIAAFEARKAAGTA